LRPGTITPVPAEDVPVGIVVAVLVPLLERKREILAGMAKERHRELSGTRSNPGEVVESLPPPAHDKTRDAVAAEIGARARVDRLLSNVTCELQMEPRPARVDHRQLELIVVIEAGYRSTTARLPMGGGVFRACPSAAVG
jgi:hypothetical protein